MRLFLYDRLKSQYSNVAITYGYITKHTRIKNKLEKTHAIDALCISTNLNVVASKNRYSIIFINPSKLFYFSSLFDMFLSFNLGLYASKSSSF